MIEIKETTKRLKDVSEYFIKKLSVITENLQRTSDSWRKFINRCFLPPNLIFSSRKIIFVTASARI